MGFRPSAFAAPACGLVMLVAAAAARADGGPPSPYGRTWSIEVGRFTGGWEVSESFLFGAVRLAGYASIGSDRFAGWGGELALSPIFASGDGGVLLDAHAALVLSLLPRSAAILKLGVTGVWPGPLALPSAGVAFVVDVTPHFGVRVDATQRLFFHSVMFGITWKR